MNGTSLILAIIGHLVGDYLLQTDWMALKKKRDSFACFVHCVIWTTSVCFFSGWETSQLAVYFLFAFHFVQDRTQIVLWWMRLPWKSQAQFTQPPAAPWSIIVVDNVWHVVQLWIAWRFLL